MLRPARNCPYRVGMLTWIVTRTTTFAEPLSTFSVAGETLTVVTPDKGNGWTKVSNSSYETGIVPTNYLQIKSGAPPPPLSRRPASSAASSSSNLVGSPHGTVTAAFAYSAGSPQELTIAKGDVLELTAKGSSYASGWTEVMKDGRRGIVPTSYVK